MSFCTVVNCMDGRVQEQVLEFMKRRFETDFVDSITEPGPNGILSRQSPAPTVASILSRLDISVGQHHSAGIAVVGHYDCAGNPGDRAKQDADTERAVRFLRTQYPELSVIGLWLGDAWTVEEIDIPPTSST